MSLKIIKFVAGAGKTTESKNYMKENNNGIYLAFNKSVVEELENQGFLAKTIDSFFLSYIIPKFTATIPLIKTGSKIKFRENNNLPNYLKGTANINIKSDGSIFNNEKIIEEINLNTANEKFKKMGKFKNSIFLNEIFQSQVLYIDNKQLEDISNFIIYNYRNSLINIIKQRFSYVIIDEAQDLKSYREDFAHLLYDSGMNFILLGDDNQNINGGGKWFESLIATETRKDSFRCPEANCKWIRENLEISIYGNNNLGGYIKTDFENIIQLDNGNRVLLYKQAAGKYKEIIQNWKGKKYTIQKAKGDTIKNDIVIVGDTLNKKLLYTAITRTTQFSYSTIKKIN